jgi:hypothetical protein
MPRSITDEWKRRNEALGVRLVAYTPRLAGDT